MFKTKIKPYFSLQRLSALAVLVFLVVLSITRSLSAQTLTQGYGTDEQLQRGMIVNLKPKDTTKVSATSSDTLAQMHGIVVNINDAPVALSSDGNKVYVSTVGHYDVLVSSQSGPINPGDYITISALSGIGMKAGSSQSFVVGKALNAFDGKTSLLSTSEIKDSEGKTTTVGISRIQVDISVGHNPLERSLEPKLPGFLKKVAESIAGKPVSPQRVYLSLAVFIVSTIAAGILLYGGVRSGLISIGRNPLSRKSIVRSMIQVIITGLIIFIMGLFGVYLLLKL